MKITERWISKNCCFKRNTRIADVLPESDMTEEEIVKKQGEWKGNDVSRISKALSKELIEQIEADFGHLKFFDNGRFGVVYRNELEPGWLIKITINMEELNALKEIENMDDVLCLVSYGRSKVYTDSNGMQAGIIETKEVKKLPSDEARIFWHAHSFIEFGAKFGEKVEGFKNYLEYLVKRREIIGKIDYKKSIEVYLKLEALIKCLASNELEHHDIKADNIGIESDGRYVIFDFGGLIKK